MKFRLPLLFVILIPLTLIEVYTYSGIASFIAQLQSPAIYWNIYYLLAILTLLSAGVFAFNIDDRTPGKVKNPITNVLSGMTMTLVLTKLSFISVMLAEDVYRIGLLGFDFALSMAGDVDSMSEFESRNVHVAQLGLTLSAIPFLSFMHGITVGKYKFKVKRVKLHFSDLPGSFNGYKIVQFSDMHSGSFDSLERVQRGFEKINAENPDLILFTGDMVNNLAEEVKPFVPMLKDLRAKDGKFSILGNHDYGDYVRWSNRVSKVENLYRLIHFQEQADFRLLMNENITISKNGEHIKLVGVENWGKPPFPQHGDLQKGMEGIEAHDFTILMSHDPSHWESEILPNRKKIHITLSGHTHGMQFGFDIPGLKWSPVKYKYPKWSGLYTELEQHLYVNNGFGFLGFPGRVGIYPEITVFELISEKA